MILKSSVFAGLVFGLGSALTAPVASAQTPAPTKVAVIDIQAAIAQTNDGQKAGADMKTKFTPKQDELQKKQRDVEGLQEQLRKGQNTLSEDNRQKMMREIDQKTNSLKRDGDDFNQDVQTETQRIMGDLYPKMITVLNKYATENGYAVVLDYSSQQTPILFAATSVDVTKDIIAIYNKTSSFAPPAGAPKTAMPAPAAPKPATPKPPVKQQE
jgi:outer membrane protein